jgi:hypothetical protein
MSGTDESKPAAKGRRSKKVEARGPKSYSIESPAPVQMQTGEREPVQVPQADPQQAVSEPVEAVVAEAIVVEAVAADPDAVAADAPSPSEPAPAEPATAEPSPVTLQTIANAYRDYTKKSFEEFGSFCEQLSGVRSLEKAMAVQAEFVKRAFESSVTESRKIRELHSKLARQTLERFQRLAGNTPEPRNKS